MKKTYSWIGSKGNKFELEAECSISLENEILDSDGYIIKTNNKEVVIDANLEAKMDGKVIDICCDTYCWKIVDTKIAGIKKIYGIDGIGFTEDVAQEIETFLKETIESSKSEEVKEFEQKQKYEKLEKEITEAKRIIAKAKQQNEIPSREQKEIWIRNYNNINNEGCEGYVPEIVDIDQYNEALSIVKQYA